MEEETIVTPAGTEETVTSSTKVDPQDTSTGSEAVTNPEVVEQPQGRGDVTVALRQAREEAKATREELQQIKENLASIGGKQEPESNLDPEVEKTLQAWADKNGLVRKADLDADLARQRGNQELLEIKGQYSLSDDDLERVRVQANKNGATNKEGLDAAYKQLFFDKIIEDKVKEALAGGPRSTVEKPGPGGPVTPGTPQPASAKGDTMQDRLKNRIKTARGA